MKMLIGNNWLDSDKSFKVIDPYVGEVVDNVAISSKEQIKQALDASYNYKCELSGTERACILRDAKEILAKDQGELAELMTRESGLCLKDTLHEVERAISCFESAIIQAEMIDTYDQTKDFIDCNNDSKPKLEVITEPYDLAVAITPFNHPLNMVAHKIAPAVASGISMVLKPSEKTPLTALKLGKILVDCGLPENMLNIVVGIPPKDIVNQLINYPKLDIVSFTGSVRIGKYIARTMAQNGNELKKYLPELGGNATFVVLDDADLKKASKVALGAFENSGQRCTAIRKILLHRAVADEFVEMFLEEVSKIKYGNPLDSSNNMGTVISSEQSTLLHNRVNKAEKDGAKLLFGNNINGALISPTVLDFVHPNMEVAEEESFGPIVSIIRVNNLSEIKNYFKCDNFGLAASVATRSEEVARDLFDSILVGQFSWNGRPGYRTEEAPFGGFKDSGNGEKEGVIMMTRAMRRIKTFYNHNN